MLPIEDLYGILGVAASASPDEIKRRYRQLVKETHPDVLPADGSVSGEPFLEIRRAYDTLADARRRAQYDNDRLARPAGAGASGVGNITAAQEVPGRDEGTGSDGSAGGLRDFVRQFFGGRWSSGSPFDGEVDDGLPLDREPSVANQRGGGSGAHYPTELVLTLRDAFVGRDFHLSGMRVRIPPGARHGARFRVPPPVGEVTTRIEPEAGFRLDGDDIETELSVDSRTRSRGGDVLVEHPAGQFRVSVPTGLRDGQLLRLRGRGLPPTATRRAGDLLVRIRFLR